MTEQTRTIRSEKYRVLSRLSAPHPDAVKTLRIRRYRWLFLGFAFVVSVLVLYGTVATLRLQRENTELHLALESENIRHQNDLADMNTLIAEQVSQLEDAYATMTGYEAGTTLSAKALDNYEVEYEGLIASYIDKSIKNVSVSRGENDNRSFKNDVATLKLLLVTVESAALDAEETKGALAAKTAKLDHYIKSLPSLWPTVPKADVASDFGRRLHPVYHYYKNHDGLDIGDHKGDPIYATGSGTVISAEFRGGYGNLVEIDHGNGYVTRYGHNAKLLVHVGQKVEQGDKIALMGATGTATSAHLHFEVRINDQPVNPEMFLSY